MQPFEIYKFDLRMRRLKILCYAETLERAHRQVYEEWHKMDGNFYFFSYPKGYEGTFVDF